jgi:hypothetical protein
MTDICLMLTEARDQSLIRDISTSTDMWKKFIPNRVDSESYTNDKDSYHNTQDS